MTTFRGDNTPATKTSPRAGTNAGEPRAAAGPDTHVPAVPDRPDREPAPGVPSAVPSLPGYELLKELGRGSMGIVYKARQISLDRIVALKMIRRDSGIAAETLSRFVDEARLVASLKHPNIIQIYEINLQDEAPFFSMELAEGGSLAEQIAGRPQPFRQAAQLTETLARAIDAAHQRGIVHRDLKPANILLTAAGSQGPQLATLPSALGCVNAGVRPWTPKITDFGLAKQLHEGGGQTESGMILGTPSYMAPEQAEGKSREVGPAADVYALGAILYEMLTGRPPFAGESPIETVLQLFQMEPVAPSRLQPKVPRDLETICLKCLNREPQRRYPDGGALAEDLRRFANGESIQARPASPVEKVWKWARRRPVWATLAASCSLALLCLVGLVAWHQVDLQVRLDQARDDERVAGRQVQLASRREGVKDLILAGETALEKQEWQAVRANLQRARQEAKDEPELADLLEQIDQRLLTAKQHRQDRERLEAFHRLRNQALFHASHFTGGDMATTQLETRQCTLEALKQFGIAPDNDGAPTVASRHFTEAEKEAVRAGCYELLLVLAEATARALPGQPQADAQRQAEQALRILDRAAQLGLVTRAYHGRRAQYLAQAGRAEAALQEREKAKATPAAGEFDLFLQGTEQYHQGDWKHAVRTFEGVLQARAEHFWGNYYLALCYLKERKPDHARTLLTNCLSGRKDMPWLYLLRGSAWAELGQFDSAEEDFAAAEKGKDLPESALYGLYINRGVMRIRQGKKEEAIADLCRATELRKEQYQGYLNLAHAFVEKKDLDEAIRQLDVAVTKAPELAPLYRTRAQVHLLREDAKAALADLDKAVALEASKPSLGLAEDHLERGRILHRRKEYAAAVKAYDAAVAVQPRYARAHRLRAEALLELNCLPEALRSLDACLKDGPPDADAFRARAAVRTRLGQYPGAQTDYTRALELAPDAATYVARGWTYLVAEAYALAVKDFDEAIKLDPDRGEAYGGRGFARAALGHGTEAVADAQEALRRGPQSPRLFYSAARIYAQATTALAADARRDVRAVRSLQSLWTDRAVQLLQQALDSQPPSESARFWQTYVQNDAALNPVRQSPGFRGLAVRFARMPG
jgi:serine/threonine protein kinase/tetratricopeptide (TPR) repeat protein